MTSRFNEALKVVATLILAVVFLSSCGQALTVHDKNLSLIPQYFIRKSNETTSNTVIYSYNVAQMRSELEQFEKTDRMRNLLTLNWASFISLKEMPAGLDSLKMDGMSSCPRYDIQSVTPASDLKDFFRKKGFIEENSSSYSNFKRVYHKDEVKELPGTVCINGDGAVLVGSDNDVYKEAANLLVKGEELPVSDYKAIKEMIAELGEYSSIAFIFPFESFPARAERGSIPGFFNPKQLQDMIPSFNIWGRNQFIRQIGVGSKVIGSIEQVRICFLYLDEDGVQIDEENIKSALQSCPSSISGRNWMSKMGFENPTITTKGNKIVIDCVQSQHKTGKGSVTMDMLSIAEKMSDWGLFWRR